MEKIREATLQYISCPDPMESAARKQRVLQSEMNGDVEEAATRILQVSASAALARTETLQLSELPIHRNQEDLPAETSTIPTRKHGRPPKPKGIRTTVRASPKTYSGMGSKKRNIVRLQASPGTSSLLSTSNPPRIQPTILVDLGDLYVTSILNAKLIGQSKVILAESFVVRLCGVEIICPQKM
ncbi:hypothetical protein YC2023_084333 [Brassica napus]